jgi:hypothetical protein
MSLLMPVFLFSAQSFKATHNRLAGESPEMDAILTPNPAPAALAVE